MSIRIMIVDDAMFMREQLKQAFTKLGAEIIAEASNGYECLEKYELYKPDLVTMDITMEKMDGISALKSLKEKHPEARVVMVSAMAQQDKFVQSIQAGAFDFIAKPFTIERIGVIIDKLKGELNA